MNCHNFNSTSNNWEVRCLIVKNFLKDELHGKLEFISIVIKCKIIRKKNPNKLCQVIRWGEYCLVENNELCLETVVTIVLTKKRLLI